MQLNDKHRPEYVLNIHCRLSLTLPGRSTLDCSLIRSFSSISCQTLFLNSAIAALPTVPTSTSSGLASRDPPHSPSSATCTRRRCAATHDMMNGVYASTSVLTVPRAVYTYVRACTCSSLLLQKYLADINGQLCRKYGDLCG